MAEAICIFCQSSEVDVQFKVELSKNLIKDVAKCHSCLGYFCYPTPTLEEIGTCYPHSYFSNFSKQYWKDYIKGMYFADRLKKIKNEGVFLDVGCAYGTLIKGIVDNSKWQGIGLEFSDHARNYGKEKNRIPIYAGGLSSNQLDSDSVDYILANNVIEHESDPAKAFSESARLLKRGGTFHVVLPNGPVDCYPNRVLFEKFNKAYRTGHDGHIVFLSKKSLEILFNKHGFSISSFKSFHIKTALKSRGLWLNGHKKFFSTNNDKPIKDGSDKLVPPRPNLLQINFRKWKMKVDRSLYFSWPLIWQDFEIIAQKK